MAAQTLLLRHDYTDFDLEKIMHDTRADTGTELTSRRAARYFCKKRSLHGQRERLVIEAYLCHILNTLFKEAFTSGDTM